MNTPTHSKSKQAPSHAKKRNKLTSTRPTLIRLIEREAEIRSITLKEAAEELGICYGYLHHLGTGQRPTDGVSRKFTTRCAKFLRTPHIAILMLAGVIKPTDWTPAEMTEEEMLCAGFLRMLEHPAGKALVGIDFQALPMSVQSWMLQMFSEHYGIDVFQTVPLLSLLGSLEQNLKGSTVTANATTKPKVRKTRQSASEHSTSL